jgi:hypothetical protein
LRFTSTRVDASFFTGHGLLAIFYRQPPGGVPSVTSISANDPATLEVGVTLSPTCWVTPGEPPPPCVVSPWGGGVCPTECLGHWGLFLLESIDKTFLPGRPQRILVSEKRYVPPPPSSCPCVVPSPSAPAGLPISPIKQQPTKVAKAQRQPLHIPSGVADLLRYTQHHPRCVQLPPDAPGIPGLRRC